MDSNDLDMFVIKRGCDKCRYQWFPRTKDTKRCPRCQTWLSPVKPNEDTGQESKPHMNKP